MHLKKYKEFLSDTKSTKKLYVEKVEKLTSEITELESGIEVLQEAREVVSAAGILAQDNTRILFETLVTQALQAVFGEEYSFELESRFFRNQPEMEMFVVENGVRYSPKDEKGGAIVDIISFGARIVSWAIQEPKSQNVLLLDEPFRCVGKSCLSFLGEMLTEISKELNLQIILITHERDISEYSERSFLAEKQRGISKVRRIK